MAWNILYLPAIVGEDETRESLWPEVFPLEKLETMRLQMGYNQSIIVTSQYSLCWAVYFTWSVGRGFGSGLVEPF
jgi:hypothetical protein